jgi:hypothetical protein
VRSGGDRFDGVRWTPDGGRLLRRHRPELQHHPYEHLLLNLVQQLITAELNLARGSSASSGVQSAIASASSAITVKLSGGRTQLSSALSSGAATMLATTLETFNSASDCGMS